MAEAWEAEQLAGVPAEDPCLIVDTGWDHVRKGSSAVQPGMSATTGRILTFDLLRPNDPGVNSSKVLEKRNFGKVLKNPLITLMMYTQVQLCASSPPPPSLPPPPPPPPPPLLSPLPLPLPPLRSQWTAVNLSSPWRAGAASMCRATAGTGARTETHTSERAGEGALSHRPTYKRARFS